MNTTEQYEADIAARDALIGELRARLEDALGTITHLRLAENEDAEREGRNIPWPETIPQRFKDTLARTPADAGAELARLREDNEQLRMEISRRKGAMQEALRLHAEDAKTLDALRAQLADLRERARQAEQPRPAGRRGHAGESAFRP